MTAEPRNCEHDTLLRGIFADTVLYGEQKASTFTVPFDSDNWWSRVTIYPSQDKRNSILSTIEHDIWKGIKMEYK